MFESRVSQVNVITDAHIGIVATLNVRVDYSMAMKAWQSKLESQRMCTIDCVFVFGHRFGEITIYTKMKFYISVMQHAVSFESSSLLLRSIKMGFNLFTVMIH